MTSVLDWIFNRHSTRSFERIPEISRHEFTAPWVIYGPLVVFWILTGFRYRDFSMPTLANPNIPVGGLCGESKGDILDQVSGAARDWIAPWHRFAAGKNGAAEALAAIAKLGLTFPVVLKPDIGCKGAGVRLIDGPDTLHETLQLYRAGTALMIQHFIPYEGEAGVFYSRLPTEKIGRILSMTFKTSPFVIGDGVATLRELLMEHPRAGKAPQVYFPRLAHRLDEIPSSGEKISLVFTGNHSKGSLFRDATCFVTPALTARIDEILRSMPEFHHGRIDLRFRSLASLQDGTDFQVIEINGIGSEPIHMWTPGTTLKEIYRIQFEFYGRAFQIGDLMRQRGYRTESPVEMLRLWRQQSALIATYPSSH